MQAQNLWLRLLRPQANAAPGQRSLGQAQLQANTAAGPPTPGAVPRHKVAYVPASSVRPRGPGPGSGPQPHLKLWNGSRGCRGRAVRRT
jgi:hypothetical protein